ncbi:NYN domain-containing protein [Lentzea waywayandensis]|uniref:NYN domain-containing protein n=1 Tax=Lentzea waywayandensis TaxID=84724 RepID=A0A1I6EW77_9PSEU|nr:NYN domain-containing protein [Lentzea waywayandensis]SFR21960.1 NYN domain-containing protein [Lentzea waywayandensis]
MQSKLAAMIDGGFLIKAGCATLGVTVDDLHLNPLKISNWCSLSARRVGAEFMRAYWYDGIHEPANPEYESQLARVRNLRNQAGIQTRLGKLSKRPSPEWSEIRKALRAIGADPNEFKKHYPMSKYRYEQKGVDTLIVLDMVRLAQLNAYDTLLLLAGDTDLAEAVNTVQDYGKRVIIARPEKCGNASDLFDLADESVTLTADTLKHMLLKAPDLSEKMEEIRARKGTSMPLESSEDD